MKKDYWNVTDDQVIEKTGKTLSEWREILVKFDNHIEKSNEFVEYLQREFDVPRFWARTLTTAYLKSKTNE